MTTMVSIPDEMYNDIMKMRVDGLGGAEYCNTFVDKIEKLILENESLKREYACEIFEQSLAIKPEKHCVADEVALLRMEVERIKTRLSRQW